MQGREGGPPRKAGYPRQNMLRGTAWRGEGTDAPPTGREEREPETAEEYAEQHGEVPGIRPVLRRMPLRVLPVPGPGMPLGGVAPGRGRWRRVGDQVQRSEGPMAQEQRPDQQEGDERLLWVVRGSKAGRI